MKKIQVSIFEKIGKKIWINLYSDIDNKQPEKERLIV